MSEEIIIESEPQHAPNSTMAIVSLVAGIIGLTFFPLLGSIVAVVTGYMAKKEINESAGSMGGEGMATAGLVMGWIGIGLGAVGLCIACAVLVLLPLGIFTQFQFTYLLITV